MSFTIRRLLRKLDNVYFQDISVFLEHVLQVLVNKKEKIISSLLIVTQTEIITGYHFNSSKGNSLLISFLPLIANGNI